MLFSVTFYCFPHKFPRELIFDDCGEAQGSICSWSVSIINSKCDNFEPLCRVVLDGRKGSTENLLEIKT